MNEKIKEFAEQAWPGLPSHWWDRRDGEVAEAVNKFAELIVRECADLYNHEDVLAPIGMSARGEAHQHGWIEGTKTYRDTILEHFGVAE
jgi:hypothetical protein